MTARDDFLRRYATSPIHIPRLERLLSVYETGDRDDSFATRFIGWDRACPDGEAARIVTEIISTTIDRAGRIVHLSDAAVRGAMRWMAEASWLPVADRTAELRDALSPGDEDARAAIRLLEAAPEMDGQSFRSAVRSLTRRP
jgi:hypothetical protein